MQDKIIGALERMRVPRTGEGRWLAAQQVMADQGSEWITLGTAPSDRPTMLSVLSSTSPDLMCDYMALKLHHVDPWMHYSARSTRPFDADLEARPVHEVPKLDSRMTGLFADHGMRHVVFIPGLSETRTRALVLYASCSDQARALRAPERRALTTTLAAVVTAFVRPEEWPEDDPQRYGMDLPLSPREREALLWLSTGLRTAAIAHRMGIESVTVSLHFNTARRKLGAATREQALAIALRDRLIQP